MKAAILLSLVVAAAASPLVVPSGVEQHRPALKLNLPANESHVPAVLEDSLKISTRRPKVSNTANEYLERRCADVIGAVPGPAFSSLIKDRYGWEKVHVQGLNYGANLLPNLNGLRTDDGAIRKLKDLIAGAVVSCDKSLFVVAGYSQGAAVVHAALSQLGNEVQDKVVAAVTFGDTMVKKNKGRIPNFPPEKTLSLCNGGDHYCETGVLLLSAAHQHYDRRAAEGARFVFNMLAKAGYN